MWLIKELKQKIASSLSPPSRNRDSPASKELKVQIAKIGNQIVLFYQSENGVANVATSKNGFDFKISKQKLEPPSTFENFPKAALVPNYYFQKQKVIFYGDRTISVAYWDKDGTHPHAKPVIISSFPVEVGNVFERDEGLLLLYFEKKIVDTITYYSAYLAFFDKEKPSRLLWKTDEPIWKHEDLWPNLRITPIGSVMMDREIICYWHVGSQVMYGVALSGFTLNALTVRQTSIKKHEFNPIISPNTKNDWEAFNTFNPAALYADSKVHILYRAQGFDYISTVGYASSSDGLTIDERLNQPIFSPTMDFETNETKTVAYNFVSGGGYGGCEDPRVTLIDDTIYMVYVAFDGWSPPRLALTSILLSDFLQKRFLWSKPVLISPPGVVDKSGCLLPEKINNKYVFFHRVFPNILIDFVDDLNFDGNTNFLPGKYEIKVREGKWDSLKIGVGAPPLKTKDGWLLIYYGVDKNDSGKYCVGAMLLDLKDPTKVLYRSNQPLLKPDEEYEMSGFKPGVVYPCGAVIVGSKLLLYYGGADSSVCIATADIETFLDELKSQNPVHLQNIAVKELTCNVFS